MSVTNDELSTEISLTRNLVMSMLVAPHAPLISVLLLILAGFDIIRYIVIRWGRK